MSNVAIITAKGNNESLPDKNLIKIMGKPALLYGIEAAKNAVNIDEVYVSTECEKIRAVAEASGCRIIKRPKELSLSDTNHGDVIKHAVQYVKEIDSALGNVTILLGNTVMVTGKIIDLSLDILEKKQDIDSVMTIWQAQDDHPYRALKINENGLIESFLDIECGTSRQEYPKVYYYDQGVWTFRQEMAMKKDGPKPWRWMGKRCFPIVRRWVTGRDFHTELDIAFSEYWINSEKEDEIENLTEINKILGSH